MGQYTAGWITVPGKGKRWRTADGEYLMQRPAGGVPGIGDALSGAVQGVGRFLSRGYGQVDKSIFKGALPGGASISSSIAPTVRAVSRSPVYAAVRDNVAVPLLDRGMEGGVVPAKEGMFLRFLSGTSKPLTRVPADTRAAEGLIRDKLTQRVSVNPTRVEADKAFQEWMESYREVNSQEEMYNMHGIGSPPNQQQLKRVNELDKRVNEYVGRLGLRDRIELLRPTREQSIKARQEAYDPRNYAIGDYADMLVNPWVRARVLDLDEQQNKLINKGLSNTLGRYQVKDGKTYKERYDFNSYNEGKSLFAPGSLVGGVIGESEQSMALGDRALQLADQLGFIQPGAGYPVEFKFR